jgi:muramoyltetrapeptide carboxypeptidase
MNSEISPLQKGDLIAIVAPAKAIEAQLVLDAKLFFETHGYRVVLGEHCLGTHDYFSGTDAQRTSDFQKAIDNPEIKAIICARGGYGCIRILDRINWAGMLRDPKWIVGFSDVTVFHQRMQKFELKSIHATMPLNFAENTEIAMESMLDALQGKQTEIQILSHQYNKRGNAVGKLIGGNFSILFSMLGTDDQPEYADTILFIEDLSEQLYHLDRMFYAFAKAGILNRINGLIVGGMTNMKDTGTSIGMSLQQIILSHFEYRKIPIVFDFPAGHITDNRALIFGTKVELRVDELAVNLSTFVS